MFFEGTRTITNGQVDDNPAAGPIAEAVMFNLQQSVIGVPVTRVALALEAPSTDSVTVSLYAMREQPSPDLSPYAGNRFYLVEAGIIVPGGSLVTRSMPRGGKLYARVTSAALAADRSLLAAALPDQTNGGTGGSTGGGASGVEGAPYRDFGLVIDQAQGVDLLPANAVVMDLYNLSGACIQTDYGAIVGALLVEFRNHVSMPWRADPDVTLTNPAGVAGGELCNLSAVRARFCRVSFDFTSGIGALKVAVFGKGGGV